LRALVLAPVLAGIVPDVKPSLELLPEQGPSGTEPPNETFQWDLPVTATTSAPTESSHEEFDLNMEEVEAVPPSSIFSFVEDSPSEFDPFASNICDTDNPFDEAAEVVNETSSGAEPAYNEIEALFGEFETPGKTK
jgi:hypothetical protein